jgi:hypothetical protein
MTVWKRRVKWPSGIVAIFVERSSTIERYCQPPPPNKKIGNNCQARAQFLQVTPATHARDLTSHAGHASRAHAILPVMPAANKFTDKFTNKFNNWQPYKFTILHYNFTIFKLRSTTEQMPALVNSKEGLAKTGDYRWSGMKFLSA